jgi:hypothetical protein
MNGRASPFRRPTDFSDAWVLKGTRDRVPNPLGPGHDTRLGSLGLIVMILTARRYRLRGLCRTRAGCGSGEWRAFPRGASQVMIGSRKPTAY